MPGRTDMYFNFILFFFWNQKFENSSKQLNTRLPNFKKAMVILILALANYLLDIVSPSSPAMCGAEEKILGFGVPRHSS